MTGIMLESFNYAILDSACTSTVCGIDWLKSYTETLSEEEVNQIVEEDSKTSFRFGDGIIQKSVKKVKIPVTLVGKKVFIQTDVVDSGLPLLFSKPSMKKARV